MRGITICLAVLTTMTLVGSAAVWADPSASESAPPEGAQTMDVEGAALIQNGDVPAARRSAIQQALREAVERAFGVQLKSTLQTRNYIATEDRIETQTSGYGIVEKVLEERTEGSLYRVKVRVRVGHRPLVDPVAAVAPSPSWRVAVVLPAAATTYYGYVRTEALSAERALIQRLEQAGLAVVDWRHAGKPTGAPAVAGSTPAALASWGRQRGADLVIAGEVIPLAGPGLSLPAGWMPFDYTRCRTSATARAVRTDTGEVVAAEALREDSDGTTRAQAVQTALSRTGTRLGDRLARAIGTLPNARAHSRRVVAARFRDAAEAQAFQDAIARVPGVRRVQREAYEGGELRLTVLMGGEAADRLGALLERSEALGRFQVAVQRDAEGEIEVQVMVAP
ncbi:MAG: flagellar assembly protein T N-terminal domain-containing protein [Armatimonadetes bacterium]|nr:flagellar assembly protein T N-terminal domain-containing protein [Armatimonadota bacterium]